MAEYKDPADASADSLVQSSLERQNKSRIAQNEIDKAWSLKGGRNNPTAFRAGGSDSSNPLHQEMGTHSAKFIEAVRKGDRGAANAARLAFHTIRSAAKGAPRNMEVPCPSGDCARTNLPSSSCEKTGGCRPMKGTEQSKVGRPRG